MSRKTARKPVEILEEEFSTNWLLNFKIKRPFYFNPKHKEFYKVLLIQIQKYPLLMVQPAPPKHI